MSDDIVARLRALADEHFEMLGNIHEPLLEAVEEIERARDLLRQCLASGTIAKGYSTKEPSRCLGDEIEEFLTEIDK